MKLPSRRVIEQRRKQTRFSNIIGADLKNPRLFNPRMMVVTVIGGSLVLVIQINGLYHAWPNILNICQTLFLIPMILQIFSRIYNRFVLKDEVINLKLQENLVKFYEKHEKNLINRIVLLEKLDIYARFFNMSFLVYFVIINTPSFGAIMSAAYTGTYQVMAPIYLPFIDSTKLFGFIINAIVHLILTEVAFFALTALDFQLMFFSYQIASMFHMLNMKLDEFSHDLSNQSNIRFKYLVQKHFTQIHQISNREQLIKIIKDYREITKFTSLLFSEMKIPVFMTITSGGIALCFSALTMLSNSIVNGALGIFFYTTQIFTSCILVTFINQEYEKFLDKIYTFPWYLLSKSDQKIYLQFLQSCQNVNDFELPMIGRVDMELFTVVVNTGYSYFMFIWNFVEIKKNFF